MVTATHAPNVLRVSCIETETDTERVELVCFCRPDESTGKIEIWYHEHTTYYRDVPHGAWEKALNVRRQLNGILRSQIRVWVMRELWDGIAAEVQSLPKDFKMPPPLEPKGRL